MQTPRQVIGTTAENLAADFLRAQGLEILLQNYRRRFGELDIVALEGEVLVIVEVRTRSSEAFGGAAASVDGWKQRKIVRTAQMLLLERKDLARRRARFDVIVVRGRDVEWIRSAFT
jgi:putative endonuclease